MIIKDADGDLWEQNSSGTWNCKTVDDDQRYDYYEYTLRKVAEEHGPLIYYKVSSDVVEIPE